MLIPFCLDIHIFSFLERIVDFLRIRPIIEFLAVESTVLVVSIIFILIVVIDCLFLLLVILISAKVDLLRLLHCVVSQIRFICFHCMILYPSFNSRWRIGSSSLCISLLYFFRFIGRVIMNWNMMFGSLFVRDITIDWFFMERSCIRDSIFRNGSIILIFHRISLHFIRVTWTYVVLKSFIVIFKHMLTNININLFNHISYWNSSILIWVTYKEPRTNNT